MRNCAGRVRSGHCDEGCSSALAGVIADMALRDERPVGCEERMNQIHSAPLTAAAFAPYGDVLDVKGDFRLINAGLCRRHHDLAQLEFGDARAGISIFHAEPRSLPYAFDLIERHPEGSQAFIPMTAHPFLVIVANSADSPPLAFVTNGAQGINLHRGTWHGVLTPLHAPGLFAVVDRIGPTPNLEEFRYPHPWTVV